MWQHQSNLNEISKLSCMKDMTFRASSNACDGLGDRPILIANFLDISHLQMNIDIRTSNDRLLPVPCLNWRQSSAQARVFNSGINPGKALIIDVTAKQPVHSPKQSHKKANSSWSLYQASIAIAGACVTPSTSTLTLKVSLGVPYSAIFCICVVSSSPWLSTTKMLRELTL